VISFLLTTAWAVFYTWLGRLQYLAGPDGPSSIFGWAGWAVFNTWLGRMDRLQYLAGPDGPSSIPGWAVFNTWLGRMGRLLYQAGPDGPSSIPGWAGWAVFYTWLGRVGWSRDQPHTNLYGLVSLLYLAGPGGLAFDQPPTNHSMGRLL
jgi:hypothetical protein